MSKIQSLFAFYSAIEECERRFPVSSWNVDGIPVWPMIRVEGRTEAAGISTRFGRQGSAIVRAGRLLRRAGSPLLVPLANLSDWKHEELFPHKTDVLFLGDGISLDCIGGSWRDRLCAPLMEALETVGLRSFLMQPSQKMLPRQQKTYSAQWIDSWGRLIARTRRARSVNVPDHVNVRALLRDKGFDMGVLDLPALAQWGVRVGSMARLFDYVLARTQPRMAMTVSYYWDLGFAFNLACRRQAILSVDIQHGAQGRHPAYNFWNVLPAEGYSVLPAAFWNWSPEDTDAINDWAHHLKAPWHRGLWGGHPQLAPWLDDASAQARTFDIEITRIKQQHSGSFDILVTLQDIIGYGGVWESLADCINTSPPSWRWWLRRHPSPTYKRDPSITKLIAIQKPNVLVEDASTLPLPALLRNVDAVLSLMSSTAIEAAFFGHRPIFLSDDARMQYLSLFKADKADVITGMPALREHLEKMAQNVTQPLRRYSQPATKETLQLLFEMANNYRSLSKG